MGLWKFFPLKRAESFASSGKYIKGGKIASNPDRFRILSK